MAASSSVRLSVRCWGWEGPPSAHGPYLSSGGHSKYPTLLRNLSLLSPREAMVSGSQEKALPTGNADG